MQHKMFVVFGNADYVRNNQHVVKEFAFDSKEELNAFILGLQAAAGWADVHVASSRKDADNYVKECLNL